MGRLGFAWETAPAQITAIAREPALHLEGVCTHFASSGNPDPTFMNEQARRFRCVLDACHRGGIPIPMRHASNSGAILADPSLDFDAVRPGIMLYGYPPSKLNARPVAVRPFLHWKTRALQVKEVPADFPVSYDSTYRTPSRTRLATLDIGYADGYTRHLTNKGSVLIGGRRRKIVGRVTMNLIVADLGPDHSVKPGDEAVLIGRQGEESIWADELASLAGTIPYEILTSIRAGNDSV
jgi:alanine racemase